MCAAPTALNQNSAHGELSLLPKLGDTKALIAFRLFIFNEAHHLLLKFSGKKGDHNTKFEMEFSCDCSCLFFSYIIGKSKLKAIREPREDVTYQKALIRFLI